MASKRAAENLVSVILAGGIGQRLWPLSTPESPKQFHGFARSQPLLLSAFERLRGMTPPARTLVITGARYQKLVAKCLPKLPARNIISEPQSKDTAAAVLLAALVAIDRFGDPTLMICPSDQWIDSREQFQKTLRSAARGAVRNRMIYTIGIAPTQPETGYGYIHRGSLLLEEEGVKHFLVKSFIEKPDRERAQAMLAQREYLWNAGIFVGKASVFLEEFARYLPDHLRALTGCVRNGRLDAGRLKRGFAKLAKISVDYGILEKSSRVCTVDAQFNWSDLGNWLAVGEVMPRDLNNNAISGGVRTIGSQGNLIYNAESHEMVALIGVCDLVVVRSGTNTLICHRDQVADLKKSLEEISLGQDISKRSR